jgi:hypothetical protein
MTFSMATLLSSDPFLPRDVREAVAWGHPDAHRKLVGLGVDEREAAELLDCVCDDCEPALAAGDSGGCFY